MLLLKCLSMPPFYFSLGHPAHLTSCLGYTIECRERKARTGRNPQTQQPLEIPATVTPGFTPGKSFKDIVKAGKDGGGAATKKASTPKQPAKAAAKAAPKARFGNVLGTQGEEAKQAGTPKPASKAAPKMRFGKYI